MPHISKKKLNKEDFNKIYKSFLRSFGKFKDQEASDRFF